MKLFFNVIVLLSCSWLSTPGLAQGTTTCPGVFAVTSGGASGCCVGAPTQTNNEKILEARATRRTTAHAAATTAAAAAVTTKTKSKTTKRKTSRSTMGPLTCATWIPVTQSNYNGLLQEASASLSSTGTNLRTTITPTSTGASATSSSAAEGAEMPMGRYDVLAVVAAALAWAI